VALGSDVSPEVVAAAQLYRGFNATGSALMSWIVLAISAGGAAYAYRRSNADFRARNVVERGVLGLLIGAASIAILTTIGILFALLFNTIEFFQTLSCYRILLWNQLGAQFFRPGRAV